MTLQMIQTIALLCMTSIAGQPTFSSTKTGSAEQLACQKYYIECLKTASVPIEHTLMSCIKKKN